MQRQRFDGPVGLESVVVGRSENTVKSYLYGLSLFLKANRFRNQEIACVTLQSRGADEAISRFLAECKAKGYAPKSVLTWLGAVKLWLTINRIPFDWQRLRYIQPKKQTIKDVKAFTYNEVKKLVLNARPGKKHLFWFYAVTGARLREALDVRVEDVDLENKPPRVYLKGTKSPSAKRIVFLPPDIAKELKSLVEGKPGNYPLFSREDDARKAPHPHRVDMSFRSLLRQTGLLQKDPSGKGYVYSLHSFRRFYETTLLNSGVSPMAAALLLGHHIGVEASYYKPTVESLAAEWSKAEKALTLFPEPRDEKEARERDERIKQLEDRLSQIEHLLSTIAELELAPGEDLGPLTSYYRAAGISRDMGLIRYVRKATAQPVEEASPKSSARL